MKETNIDHLLDFLHCRTPQAWIDAALQPQNLSILLIDHLNCEYKAAQTAQSLMSRYGMPKMLKQKSRRGNKLIEEKTNTLINTDKSDLLLKMSKLAREELRHFEQVLGIMKKRDVAYTVVSACQYATGLHQHVRTWEPAKLTDTLIIGAIIEARSCERFAALAPLLDDELKAFYLSLLKSESRHYADYLSLAKKYAGEPIDERVNFFLEQEQQLIESKDEHFRFHGGVPIAPH